MRHSIKLLILILLFASSAFGQALPIRNDTPSNLRDLGANLNVGRNFSVDQKGRILLGAPGTGTTDLGKAEDTLRVDGGTGVAILATRQDGFSARTDTDGDYTYIMANSFGVPYIDMRYAGQSSTSDSLLHLEDLPADNGGAGVFIFQHANDALASRCASGDYCPFSGDNRGVQWNTNTGNAAGGSTTYSKISTADNNSVSIKGSAGTVYSIQASNINAAVRYLKLYNKATAPTCGTDAPVLRIGIAASAAPSPAITFPTGASFPLGIGICIVTGITDADNTSTAASEQLVNITYN